MAASEFCWLDVTSLDMVSVCDETRELSTCAEEICGRCETVKDTKDTWVVAVFIAEL